MTSIEIANNAAAAAAAAQQQHRISALEECNLPPSTSLCYPLFPYCCLLAGRASSPAVSWLCNSTRIQLCSTKLLYFISCCCRCSNSLPVARVIDMALFSVAFPFPQERPNNKCQKSCQNAQVELFASLFQGEPKRTEQL